MAQTRELRNPPDRADARRLQSLIDRVREATGIDPVAEHKQLALRYSKKKAFAIAHDANDRFDAAAIGIRPAGAAAVGLVGEPGVDPDSLQAVLIHTADLLGRATRDLLIWVTTDEVGAFLNSHADLRLEREVVKMTVDLPLTAANIPIVVRSFDPEVDAEQWMAANRRAFSTHPEQGQWEAEDLQFRVESDWFDADDFLIHEIDGQIAAWCWTKIVDHPDHLTGEIYIVGVDPPFHGLGLGRAMTMAGLERIGSRGVTRAHLYVEADNLVAVKLYESLGFVPHHVDRAFAWK